MVLFAFYVVNYFVIVFFNAALVSCALKRMAGENPTVGYGLQQAVEPAAADFRLGGRQRDGRHPAQGDRIEVARRSGNWWRR